MIPYFYIHKHLYPTLYNPIIVYKLASVAIEILFGICIYNHRTTKTNQKYPSVNL